MKFGAAIIGSGNIGTDLMMKLARLSNTITTAAMVGIDPRSDGLQRAQRMAIPTTADGVEGLIRMPEFNEIDVVFDATSATAHHTNAAALAPYAKTTIDLTPAATGPFVVPAVNLAEHRAAPEVNMVTCGGQATIPVVAAVAEAAPVRYAEIVASIASRSAGPGTRANIDEFTATTARAIEEVAGADRGKAIIVINPAEPPMIMRDTVFCLVDDADPEQIRERVRAKVSEVSQYVPGYRLKQEILVDPIPADEPLGTLVRAPSLRPRWRVAVFLEVAGAAHYLPAYAGNLDIMTSAALRTAEVLVARPDAEADGSNA